MKHQSTTQNQSVNRKAQRGQSLVEVALFFPIFIILLAGLVEVSQLLVTQNRVSSAARAATRFASNGGQDEGIPTTILNTVTQTLEFDESVWDVWSIRATVNANGTDFQEWQFTHLYGISNTVRAPSVNEDDIRERVLDELQRDELDNPSTEIAEGLQIVGTYAIHDVDSILGLDAMSQLAGFSSINALSIMRITADGQNVTNGCAAFPIAVREGERSVTAPNTGSNPYPNASQFDYPSPNNTPVYESFTSHTDEVPLLSATEGDVFRIQNGFGQGNFGWLAWNEGLSGQDTLVDSLSWPGDSTNYNLCTGGAGCSPGTGVPGSGFNRNVRGYINPTDPRDHAMHVGDWVWGGPGSVSSSQINTTLQSHMSLDRHLRVVVWNESAAGGSNGRYRISGFAIFRLVGYSLNQSQGGSWILAEFIRWDNSCGQVN